MAGATEKQPGPGEAPTDQPSFANNEVSADEADMALAAMGYKPVSGKFQSPESTKEDTHFFL